VSRPRDPVDLARVAPQAVALAELLDAAWSLLMAVESGQETVSAARLLRALWDRTVARDNPEERAARRRIEDFMAGPDEPADITQTRSGIR